MYNDVYLFIPQCVHTSLLNKGRASTASSIFFSKLPFTVYTLYGSRKQLVVVKTEWSYYFSKYFNMTNVGKKGNLFF